MAMTLVEPEAGNGGQVQEKRAAKHALSFAELTQWLGQGSPTGMEVKAYLEGKSSVQSSHYSSLVSELWERFNKSERGSEECFVAAAVWLAGSRSKQWMQMGVAMLGAAWGKGSLMAGFHLASEVRRGAAVDRSPHRAREILDRVVLKTAHGETDSRGMVLARHLLGLMCLKGEGGVVDVREGMAQLAAASQEGSRDASLVLAKVYHGKMPAVGAPYSLDMAAQLYGRAVEQGDERSGKAALGLLHIGNEITGADPAKGMRLLRQASARGDASAIRVLGGGGSATSRREKLGFVRDFGED